MHCARCCADSVCGALWHATGSRHEVEGQRVLVLSGSRLSGHSSGGAFPSVTRADDGPALSLGAAIHRSSHVLLAPTA